MLSKEGPPIITKAKLLAYSASAFVCGSAQLGVETAKAVTGNTLKFPEGMSSLNPAEEIIEGGAPAVVGAMAGQTAYRLIAKHKRWEHDERTEVVFILTGAAVGFDAMVLLGGILHQVLDVPDVKWGPFK